MMFLDPVHQQILRYSTIRSVLSLDLEHHLDNLGVLKSKLAGDFPLPFADATFEERLLMLGFSLKMADMGWACRPVNLFIRHADAMLDELIIQGDLEKQLGVPVLRIFEILVF